MKLIVTTVALMVCCMNAVFGESEVIESVCWINGQSFALGESVGRVIDGCNNCWCELDGNQPLDCEIQGQQYKDYDVIPSDECGECRCMNGNLACTNCPV